MTTHFTHSSVPHLYKRIVKGDVEHRLALIALTRGDGWGVAVVDGESGGALAWDGMYFDDDLPDTTPLHELDWGDWDDMPSKLVFQAQAPWLAGPLGFSLMPSYSVVRKAAELVHGWGDNTKVDASHLSASTLRCYLPVVDDTAYERELERLRTRPARR